MKTIQIKLALLTLVALLPLASHAQIYDTNGDYVETFAGSGFSGYLDGVGQLTTFNNPNQIVADSHGNLFVWDSNNNRIRQISPNGTVTTFAGGSTGTTYQGTGTNVNFPHSFNSLTIDGKNTLWASSPGANWLYKITTNAVVTYTDLSSIIGTYNGITGICADSIGNIYLSTGPGNQIFRYGTNGSSSVFAGSGNSGYADGNGLFTAFNRPASLAADGANNIYVWDFGNYLIRRIDQSQNVTTFAGKYQYGSNADGIGTNVSFGSIYQMCMNGFGELIIAAGDCIREISPSTNAITMAGTFTQAGYTNGYGNLARFNGADGVCFSGGTIYVADSSNQRIRNITFNPTSQVVSGANLGIGNFAGVTITGTVGRTYQIQSSPNMSTWTTQTTLLLTSSPYLWFDQNPIGGNKFYRALLLP